MDRALNELEADPRVTFYLLPLPASDPKRHQTDSEPVVTNPNKFHKGGKGKGKGKEFASVPKNLPEELKGKVSQDRQESLLELQFASRLSKWSQGWSIVAGLIVCRTTQRVVRECNQYSCEEPRQGCLGKVSLRYTS